MWERLFFLNCCYFSAAGEAALVDTRLAEEAKHGKECESQKQTNETTSRNEKFLETPYACTTRKSCMLVEARDALLPPWAVLFLYGHTLTQHMHQNAEHNNNKTASQNLASRKRVKLL